MQTIQSIVAGIAVLVPMAAWAEERAATEPAPLAIVPKVTARVRPLPLADVRLTGGPLKQAQDLDAAYLLALDPDRMMVYLRVRAGLQPKADKAYGGWDGSGRQLTGHIAGHYLSAVSYMYAATGDARFRERGDYLVAQFQEVQDAQGDGYIGGLLGNRPRQWPTTAPATRPGVPTNLADGKDLFAALAAGDIRSSGFDLNGMWSPWYVQHKLFAGLRDAYRMTGNRAALEVEKRFAAWAEGVVGKLSDAQVQRMLDTEFGGMNEVLADLYADTGDPRWLELSRRFRHAAIVEPLADRRDILNGKHGNTQVPKLLGELKRYLYTGEARDGAAALYFFDEVAQHHSFATGGHGRNEYFGKPDLLTPMLHGRTAETCNVYNMLKFERELFALSPDPRLAEFQERALFNHILASIHPTTGRSSYMVPVGQGVMQEYDDGRGFTCCVGTGMESHALHGYGLYDAAGTELWVNFFAPSVARWKEHDATLTMETTFPEGDAASLALTLPAPRMLSLHVRRPAWAKEGFTVQVNGQPVQGLPAPGQYVVIRREWSSGDRVALTLPKTLWKETLSDDPSKAALLWGPLVLAGDLGSREGPAASGSYGIFVSDEPEVGGWLKPVAGEPGAFKAAARGGTMADITFRPFYRTHDRRYGIYWDVMTTAQWNARAAALAAEQEQRRRLEAATVAFVQPGEMQPERDFNYQAGDETRPVRVEDRPGRRSPNWFSFDVPADPSHPLGLIVTYRNDEPQRRQFEVLVEGQRIAEQALERLSPQEVARFVEVAYAIPAEVVAGKQKLTVRFQAKENSQTGRVFGVRVIRTDAPR